MTTIYDNKRFAIHLSEYGGYWLDNHATGMTTSATVYHDNTIGYDHPGYTTKAMRQALHNHIKKTTGKPAMQWASPVHRDFGLVEAVA